MSDVPYFKPHLEGPIFNDGQEAASLIDAVETFLDCSDRDVEAAVAKQNRRDIAETSFKLWIQEQIQHIQD